MAEEGTPVSEATEADPATPTEGDKPAEAGTLLAGADGTNPAPAEEPAGEGPDPASSEPEGNEGEGATDEVAEPAELSDFTLPDGVEADQVLLGDFKSIAQELGLTQEGAQKLVDLYAGQVAAELENAAKQQEEWVAQVQKDPKSGENLGLAKSALVRLADEDTQNLIMDGPLGNHPGLINFLSKVGKMTAEHDVLESGRKADTRSVAERLYPNG